MSLSGTGIAGASIGSGGGRLESKLSMDQRAIQPSLSALENIRSPCHITLRLLDVTFVWEDSIPIDNCCVYFRSREVWIVDPKWLTFARVGFCEYRQCPLLTSETINSLAARNLPDLSSDQYQLREDIDHLRESSFKC